MNLLSEETKQGHLTVAHVKNGEKSTTLGTLRAPIVCGVILTDARWSALWMRELLESLILQGVAYFAFHGHRCKEAHDLADRVRDEVMMSTDDKIIMTTWHDRESLVDYLWFVANTAAPSEGYWQIGPVSYLVVEVGDCPDADLVAAVREVFL